MLNITLRIFLSSCFSFDFHFSAAAAMFSTILNRCCSSTWCEIEIKVIYVSECSTKTENLSPKARWVFSKRDFNLLSFSTWKDNSLIKSSVIKSLENFAEKRAKFWHSRARGFRIHIRFMCHTSRASDGNFEGVAALPNVFYKKSNSTSYQRAWQFSLPPPQSVLKWKSPKRWNERNCWTYFMFLMSQVRGYMRRKYFLWHDEVRAQHMLNKRFLENSQSFPLKKLILSLDSYFNIFSISRCECLFVKSNSRLLFVCLIKMTAN